MSLPDEDWLAANEQINRRKEAENSLRNPQIPIGNQSVQWLTDFGKREPKGLCFVFQ